MNEFLRDRIIRKLEALPDERLYQVLDYVEFLDSKYAARQNPSTNVFQRFAEGVEDKLRAGRVSASTISETMNLMNRAMTVLSGVAAAGKSVANDIVGAASSTGTSSTSSSSTPSTPGPQQPPPQQQQQQQQQQQPQPQSQQPSQRPAGSSPASSAAQPQSPGDQTK